MQVYESQDCDADPDTRMTTFCRFDYRDVHRPAKKGHASMLGCQRSNHDQPSALAMRSMRSVAAGALNTDVANVDVRASCHAIGAWSSELTADELMSKKMASNCSPTFNLNDVTGFLTFTCRYTGDAPGSDGTPGSNEQRTWKGQIATCSRANDAQQTEADVKKIAQRMMGGAEAGIDITKIQCNSYEHPTP